MRALTLEARLAQLGMPVQVEAGPVGLVVYGASTACVATAAKQLVDWARLVDDGARCDRVAFDGEEPAETRFITTVHVCWARVPSRAA